MCVRRHVEAVCVHRHVEAVFVCVDMWRQCLCA